VLDFKRVAATIVVLGLVALPITACEGRDGTTPPTRTEQSHGSAARPDYDLVFRQRGANQIDIIIAPEDWAVLRANMSELFGPGEPGRPPRPGQRPPDSSMWVPATVRFNGLVWDAVGFRFVGGATLAQAWSTGTLRLPLMLDFDQMTSQYPAVEGQRFYGFERLLLTNDLSDLTRASQAGARSAYYRVSLNHGEGPVDLGTYLMVEMLAPGERRIPPGGPPPPATPRASPTTAGWSHAGLEAIRG
jgi:hypothetical protein